MDLPVIETPLAPRWIWMEEVTYSHIPIATLITAFLVLAPIFEWVGMRKNDQRYDRLAKSLVYFCMILYSPGAGPGHRHPHLHHRAVARVLAPLDRPVFLAFGGPVRVSS